MNKSTVLQIAICVFSGPLIEANSTCWRMKNLTFADVTLLSRSLRLKTNVLYPSKKHQLEIERDWKRLKESADIHLPRRKPLLFWIHIWVSKSKTTLHYSLTPAQVTAISLFTWSTQTPLEKSKGQRNCLLTDNLCCLLHKSSSFLSASAQTRSTSQHDYEQLHFYMPPRSKSSRYNAVA